jgi:surface polysaccharide O-acyltransferase-like enzyme
VPTVIDAETSERIQYLDVLRMLAMAAVVFIHASTGTLSEAVTSPAWHLANVLTSVFSASVPLFFMISGALLLDSPKTLSVRYTLRTRVLRLLVPLLVWSFIYVAYDLVVSWRVNGSPDWADAVARLKSLPGDPVIVPLWFMYAIIGAYLLSPLLKRLVDGLTRSQVIYLLVIWALASCLLPTMAALMPESVSPLFTLNAKYGLDFFGGYLGYFLLGYYLAKTKRSFSKSLLVLLICFDAAVIAVGTWRATQADIVNPEAFKSYLHVFTVVMSSAMFLLFKEVMRQRSMGRILGRTVSFLAPLAFGVYLVHSLMIDLFTSWKPITSVGLLLAYYVCELVGSILVVAALSSLKPFSYVFVGRPFRAWWRSDANAAESPPL